MQYIKLVVGLDIAKDSFTARIGTLDSQLKQYIGKACSFSNEIKGFKKLLSWIRKSCQNLKIPVSAAADEFQFVMEATGVYYENLAYFLSEENKFVSVILPNKIKNFAKTLDNKSKTDDIDAAIITQFGLEKTLNKWDVPGPNFRKLKELAREYQNILQSSTAVKNQLHAKEHSHSPVKETIKRLKEQLKLYNHQLRQIKIQIEELINQDDDLNSKIKKIQTIDGVGLMTVVSIIAETNGFALIKNAKQLTSYAGLDIVHRQSGKVTGKTSISKKGNKFIRKAIYMPALCACRCNKKLKEIYIKLTIRKNYKKIGIIAVARKLLSLIYTLWKNNTEYNPNYLGV
jgi:transposase